MSSAGVFTAILALDSYYDRDAPNDLVYSSLGNVGLGDAAFLDQDLDGDFFASAYAINGTVVISYRGTDTPLTEFFGTDIPIVAGDYDEAQIFAASDFYNTVRATTTGDILLTGHSLGGALAGFVAGFYGQTAYAIDHIAFGDALESFETDYALYLEFRDDPQAYAVFLANGGAFDLDGFRNTVLVPMGIDPDGALPISTGSFTSTFLNGSIANITRVGNQDYNDVATPLHGGLNFGWAGPFNAHSASWNVIFGYGELYQARGGEGTGAWKVVLPQFLRALDNDRLAESIGVEDPSPLNPLNNASDSLSTMIAYSAIETGVRPFGDTGVKALFNDMTELGTALTGDDVSIRLTFAKQAIANTVVTYAGALAHQKVLNETALHNPLTGIVFNYLQQGQSFTTIDFSTNAWGWVAGMESANEPSFMVQDAAFEYALFGENVSYLQYEDVVSVTIWPGMFNPFETPGNPDAVSPAYVNSVTFQASDADGVTDLSVLPFQAITDIHAFNVYVSGNGSDIVGGSAGNDIILGNGGDDTLIGGGGIDVLVSGNWEDGNDYLYGGAGDDTLISGFTGGIPIMDNGADILEGGAGNDSYFLATDPDLADIVIAGPGDERIDGGDISDRIVLRASDLGVFVDDLTGVTQTLSIMLRPVSGTATGIPALDAIRFTFHTTTGEIYDEDGTLIRTFDVLNISVYKGDHDLSVYGPGLPLDHPDTFAHITINEFYNGLFGIDLSIPPEEIPDTHNFIDVPPAPIAPEAQDTEITNLAAFVDSTPQGSLIGSDVFAGSGAGTPPPLDVTGTSGDDNLAGAGGNDTIRSRSGVDILIGYGGEDRLIAGDGNDALYGGDDNDNLIGGAGGDMVDGGTGIDFASYTSSNASVTIDLDAGTGSGGDAEGDTLVSIENLRGSQFDDDLAGGDGENRLVGLDGDDVLDGRGGDDRLVGGLGGDTLIGGDGIDWAIYAGAAAGVTVDLVNGGTGGEAAGDNYAGVENVRGSAFDDAIFGDDAQNRLVGAEGDDVLDGRGGGDRLLGNTGVNMLTGGAGNDLFIMTAGAFDTITDFTGGTGASDRVSLRALSVTDFSALQALATEDTNGVQFDFGVEGTLTLQGVALADLAVDDFLFA